MDDGFNWGKSTTGPIAFVWSALVWLALQRFNWSSELVWKCRINLPYTSQPSALRWVHLSNYTRYLVISLWAPEFQSDDLRNSLGLTRWRTMSPEKEPPACETAWFALPKNSYNCRCCLIIVLRNASRNKNHKWKCIHLEKTRGRNKKIIFFSSLFLVLLIIKFQFLSSLHNVKRLSFSSYSFAKKLKMFNEKI